MPVVMPVVNLVVKCFCFFLGFLPDPNPFATEKQMQSESSLRSRSKQKQPTRKSSWNAKAICDKVNRPAKEIDPQKKLTTKSNCYPRAIDPQKELTRQNCYYPKAICDPRTSKSNQPAKANDPQQEVDQALRKELEGNMIGRFLPEWLAASLKESWSIEDKYNKGGRGAPVLTQRQDAVDIWATLNEDNTDALYTFLYARSSFASLQTLSYVDRSSLLHEACRLGAYRCCEVLLSEGALPNQCSVPESQLVVSSPALHTALRHANLTGEGGRSCWRLLLQHLINMDADTLWNQRPRESSGLDETGHEFLATDSNKNTNLHVAMETQNQECVDLLQRHMTPNAWCAMLCAENAHGDNPSQHAARFRVATPTALARAVRSPRAQQAVRGVSEEMQMEAAYIERQMDEHMQEDMQAYLPDVHESEPAASTDTEGLSAPEELSAPATMFALECVCVAQNNAQNSYKASCIPCLRKWVSVNNLGAMFLILDGIQQTQTPVENSIIESMVRDYMSTV